MKILLACLLCSLLLAPVTVTAQKEPSPEAEAFYKKAMAEINPKHVRWIKTTAAEVNEKKLSEEDVMTRSRAYGVLGSMNGQDIEAIAFLVLMQASKSAQEDLKAIMAQVKATNEKKEKIRAAEAVLNDRNRTTTRAQFDSFKLLLKPQPGVQRVKTTPSNQPVSAIEIDDMKKQLKDQRDSLAELGEEQQLRLQMTMDRMSKMMSTLSNLLKKISDTQNQIVQNLK